MSKYEYVSEMVDSLKEMTILEYTPQQVTRDLANMIIKNFEKPYLLEWEIDEFCDFGQKVYVENKIGASDLAEQFADELLFEVCFQLANQKVKFKVIEGEKQ